MDLNVYEHKGGRRVLDAPNFAPVYRYRGLISYSLLQLILKKGNLRLNPRTVSLRANNDRNYTPPGYLIDLEIERDGGRLRFKRDIRNGKIFVSALTEAMILDAHQTEADFPGYTNVIICEDIDSLNLLLLPWSNPVIVASADPNYLLVRRFIEKNGLKFDVIKLEDERNANLEREILINCCRINLAYRRCSGHLKEITTGYDRKVILWMGQAGSAFLTPRWRSYRYFSPQVGEAFRDHFSFNPDDWPVSLQRARHQILGPQNSFFEANWKHGAHGHGVYLGFLHELTGVPVLSAYHGPHVTDVISKTDFAYAIQEDLQPLVGEKLFGETVKYPDVNPESPASSIREGISGVEIFLQTLKKYHKVYIYS